LGKVFEGCKSPKREDVKSETETKYASCPNDSDGAECGGDKGACSDVSLLSGRTMKEYKCTDDTKFTGEDCSTAKITYVEEAKKEGTPRRRTSLRTK
jgi:hypothetical protein